MKFEKFNEIMGGIGTLDTEGDYKQLKDNLSDLTFYRLVQEVKRTVNLCYLEAKSKFRVAEYLKKNCKKNLEELEKCLNNDIKMDGMDEKTKEALDRFKTRINLAIESVDNKFTKLTNILEMEPSVYYDQTIYIPDSKFYGGKSFTFTEQLFPNGEPKLGDVRQSRDAACFLLAPLASIARNNPEVIKNIIHENEDGQTVTVSLNAIAADKNGMEFKFPFHIKIDKTLPGFDKDAEPWVQLIEKAYAASRLSKNFGVIKVDENVRDGSIFINLELGPGGAPELSVETLSPVDMEFDSTKEADDVKRSADIDEGYQKLCQKLFEASENNAVMYMNNEKHVVVVNSIIEENGEYYVEFYDQMKKSTERFSLRDMYYKTYKDQDEKDVPTGTRASKVNRIVVNTAKDGQIVDSQIFNLAGIVYDINHGKKPEDESLKKSKMENRNKQKADARKEFAEESKLLAEEYAKKKAEEEAKKKAEEEAKKKAEEEAKKKAEEEAKKKAEEEAKKKAEEEAKKAREEERKQEELRELAELEARNHGDHGDYEEIGAVKAQAEEEMNNIFFEERKSDASVHINPEPEKAQNQDVSYITQGQFGAIAKKLENAKTWYNSSEYNDLVKAVERINVESKIDKDSKLDQVHKYAVKLWAVKKQIDKYLQHKAEGGVKQNAFDKMAVVEELNKMISDRLQILNVPKFDYGKYTVDLQELTCSYKDEVKKYGGKNGQTAPIQMSEEECKRKYVAAKSLYMKLDSTDFKNADDCMCKIMLRAKGKMVESIKDMRTQFQNHPNRELRDVKKAPQLH